MIKPRYLGPKWYVAASNGYALNDTASNFNTGSSTRPLSHIKNAMSILASGDTIVLQGGTHSGSSNRNISLPSDKSFVLMGDPSVNASTVIIDAGERSNHFNFNNTDSTHQIIGLKLINGKTTNSNSGGSITISRSSPIIRNVIFEKNYSTGDQNYNGAGAIYIENGSPTIEGSTFDGKYI